jgi:hypothetical protein
MMPRIYGVLGMPESPEITETNRGRFIKCLKCRQYIRPDSQICPICGHPVAPRTVDADELTISTIPLVKPPTDKLAEEQLESKFEFPADASAVLQFLPTGACVSLTLELPMVLGRGLSPDLSKMLDLTDFQALQYGVSRQHCKLERRGIRLYAADLGSTNGTYLNGKRLLPFQDQMVGHGDRLILGALHVVVMFSNMG